MHILRRELAIAIVLSVYITNLDGLPVEDYADVENDGILTPSKARMTRKVGAVKVFDFGDMCPDVRLKLDNITLNIQNLVLSKADRKLLAPHLYGQTLSNQMEVWCKTAELSQELAASINRTVTEFDISQVERFQDDIILTKDDVDAAVGLGPGRRKGTRSLRARRKRKGKKRPKRKIIAFPQFFWTGGVIPFQFQRRHFRSSERRFIRQAIAHWEQSTCLRFPEYRRIRRAPHLRFIKSNGCWSYIGKQPAGQYLSIGSGCFLLGIVAHEIGHAAGFSHEQSRPDRDGYVSIGLSNIRPGTENNFFQASWDMFRTSGVPYDYSSVMHYGAKDFSINSQDTVITEDSELRSTIGQRDGLSFSDAKLANFWYCSGRCSDGLEWSECEREGYRDPNNCNQCACPGGFAPPLCKDVAVNPNCGAQQTLTASSSLQNLTSPGYFQTGHPNFIFCPWLIQAPDNKRIVLDFIGDFGFETPPTSRPACRAYVEVRYKNMALAGPRHCGASTPSTHFVSHGSEILLTMSTRGGTFKGFQVQYQTENCGGCSSDASDDEPACLRTDLFSCDEEGQINTCYDVEPSNKLYCCDGFTLSGTNCLRDTAQ